MFQQNKNRGIYFQYFGYLVKNDLGANGKSYNNIYMDREEQHDRGSPRKFLLFASQFIQKKILNYLGIF